MIKDLINNGSRKWFEYHCWESHDSGDAKVWYRSHEMVTVIALTNYKSSLHDDTDFNQRNEDCCQLVYRAKWDDGFEWDVWEDELLNSKDDFQRPDPPSPK